MPENHAPIENIPIALRLIPLMAGWSCNVLKEITTEEICEKILLQVYDWKSDQVQEPVPPSRILFFLNDCSKDESIKELIETIPTQFFVWSNDLDVAHHNYYTYTTTEPPGDYSLSPDWSPDISKLQTLFCECPNAIMKLLNEENSSSAKIKSKIDTRKSELHDRAVRIYKNALKPKPDKKQLCELLKDRWNENLPQSSKPLSTSTIMREIEFKNVQADAKNN